MGDGLANRTARGPGRAAGGAVDAVIRDRKLVGPYDPMPSDEYQTDQGHHAHWRPDPRGMLLMRRQLHVRVHDEAIRESHERSSSPISIGSGQQSQGMTASEWRGMSLPREGSLADEELR